MSGDKELKNTAYSYTLYSYTVYSGWQQTQVLNLVSKFWGYMLNISKYNINYILLDR